MLNNVCKGKKYGLYSQSANIKDFISKDVNVLSKVPVYLFDILRDISENLNNIFNVVQKRKEG